MKTFDELYESIIQHEGYYANLKGDRGGETYMGVARKLHPEWNGWSIIDEYKTQNGAIKWNSKIENTDLDQLVKAFYYHKFYLRYGINKIENGSLQEIIIDWCVNSGRNGAKGVQRVLNNPFLSYIKVDGVLGQKTISAINSCNSQILFDEIKNARIRYYYKIAEIGENGRFLEGWLKRIEKIVFDK